MQNTQNIRFVPIKIKKDEPLKIVPKGYRSGHRIDFLHYHDLYEIGFCRKGAGLLSFDNEIIGYQEGDITLIPPTKPHRAQSLPDTISHWTWIFFDPMKLSIWESDTHRLPKRHKPIFHSSEFPNIRSIMDEILFETEQVDWENAPNIKHLFSVLLRRIAVEKEAKTKPGKHQIQHHELERITPALEHINHHYSNNIRIPVLAKSCGMSIRSFQNTFQATMQMSPSAYITKCRLEAACAFLKCSHKSISEIAYDCGFNSFSSFTRHFKKHIGHTPREERNLKNSRAD